MLNQQVRAYNPMSRIRQAKIDNERLEKQLYTVSRQAVENKSRQVDHLIQSLDLLSPLNILGRGFAVARQNQTIIKSTEQININESLDVTISDGTVKANITGISKDTLINKSSEE
jgi:exodeoxyribonuclease VII large subunit